MAPKLLDDWANVLHKQFPDATDADVWRATCMLLLILVQPDTKGSAEGVAAVSTALQMP